MIIKRGMLVAGVTALVLAGGHIPTITVTSSSEVFAAARLDELKGVEELQTLFNRDAGKVRLVLLVSPT